MVFRRPFGNHCGLLSLLGFPGALLKPILYSFAPFLGGLEGGLGLAVLDGDVVVAGHGGGGDEGTESGEGEHADGHGEPRVGL